MKPLNVRNGGKSAELLIYQDIGPDLFEELSAKTFVEQLNALKGLQEINVRINSEGGDVFHAIGIFNALERHPARIVVDIDGLALSAASLVAQAGDVRRMAADALMMVHRPSGRIMGLSEDIRGYANRLDQIEGIATDIYARKTKLPLDRVTAMLTAETWMLPHEALAAGFVDKVADPSKMAAKFDPGSFRNVPSAAQEWLAKHDGRERMNGYRDRIMAAGTFLATGKR